MRPFHFLLPFLLSSQAISQDMDFAVCIADFQQQARNQSISEPVITNVIGKLELQTRVVELDRAQPEFVQTFAHYLNLRVTDARVEKGRQLLAQNRDFLNQLTLKYGIPGQYLVAFWGLETNFGSYLGTMPTLDSLATLACDPRRSSFFTSELMTALKLLERESLDPSQMKGSWAGAMGHTQFMPSNYWKYAVDGDGDGRADLWGSQQDALASGANFLMNLGWKRDEKWGREVVLPTNFNYSEIGTANARPLADWISRGVTQIDGKPLPQAQISGSILVPAGSSGPAFLVYDNFAAIMKWNRSESYAISVGYLADRIAGAGLLHNPPPIDQVALTKRQVLLLQESLMDKGYEVGTVDGVFGSATRTALSAFQSASGLIADGFPTKETVLKLNPLIVADPTDG